MTHETTPRRTPLALIAWLLILGLPVVAAAADEHLATAKLAKAAVACQKVIAQASAKILTDKQKALDTCANAALTCVETKHDDAGCLGKAGSICAKQLEKAATSLTKTAAKIVSAKSCATGLRLPDLLGTDGLGLGDIAGTCQTDFGLDVCAGLEPLATCLLRTRDRAAGVAYGEARPRTGELLGLLPTALPAVDGLPTYVGCGTCAAPPDRRKAVEQCGKALSKARQGLGASLEKTLGACAQKVLACVETKSDDPKCLAGATAGCNKADAKISALLTKFTTAVAKKCDAAAVDFATLSDHSGLAFAALATTCTTVPSDAAALATCLQTRAQCTTAELVRQAIPRVDAFGELGHLGALAPDLTVSCAAALSNPTARTSFAPRPFVFGSILKFLKGVRRTLGSSSVLASGGRPTATGFGRGVTRVSGPARVHFGGISKIQFHYKIGGGLSRAAREARVAAPPVMIVAVQRADVSLDDHFEVTLAPPPGVLEVDDELEVTYQDAIPGCAFSLALATKVDGVVSEYTTLPQVVDIAQPTPTPTVTATPPPLNVTLILDASGDGGGNTLADALGIATDATGNLYVAGGLSDNAFMRTPGGTVTAIIDATGDGLGNTLNFPVDVAVDGSGNVYVVSGAGDPDTNVFKIASGGGITRILDTTGDGLHLLSSAGGVAVDGAETVYVTGVLSDNAFKRTSGGTITQIIDASGDGVGQTLNGPEAIAVNDTTGDVFVAGRNSDNVFKITSAGVITQIIDASGDGTHTLAAPSGVAVDGAGTVYVVGNTSDNAFKIAPGGTITQIIDASGTGGGNQFTQPIAVTVQGTDVYVVGGASSRRGFKITSGGIITKIIDPIGDGLGHVLQAPADITADGFGNVFVSDHGDQVFEVSP